MTTFVDQRDMTALRRHYEIERELADRLRACPQSDRPTEYRNVYEELFRRVPDHPQNVWKAGELEQAARSAEQLRMLTPYLRPDSVFVEIGCGDGHLARTVARQVTRSFGVDITSELGRGLDCPPNYAQLVSTDGFSIPLPDARATVAYSNMLLEHLHPQDAERHLHEVLRVLRPGGVYVMRTPHRYAGPQDISQFFDDEATGLHLKEYTLGELTALFRSVGFAQVKPFARARGRLLGVPTWAALGMEKVLSAFSPARRKKLCRSALLRSVFSSILLVARKASTAPKTCPSLPSVALAFA